MRVLLVAAVHGLVDEQAGLGPVVGEQEEELVFEEAIEPSSRAFWQQSYPSVFK